MSIKRFESDLRKAFLSGLASFAQLNYKIEKREYNTSLSDKKALEKDWIKVGEYLKWSINEYDQQYANSK